MAFRRDKYFMFVVVILWGSIFFILSKYVGKMHQPIMDCFISTRRLDQHGHYGYDQRG